MDQASSFVSRRGFVSSVVAVGAGAWLSQVRAQDKPKGESAHSAHAEPAAKEHKAGSQAKHEGGAAEATSEAAKPTLSLRPLPYSEKALEPYISSTTLSYHYGKHHKGYVEKVNTLTEGTPLAGKPLEEIVKRSAKGGAKQKKLFQSAAQAWNHDFYWQSMKPKGGGEPTGALKERIDKDFGSYAGFREQFMEAAVGHFSNGWAWLVLDRGKLKVVDTDDADTPLVHGQKPLLTTDVWEHAYYLDYKNARKDYVTAFLDHLLNWDFVSQNLG